MLVFVVKKPVTSSFLERFYIQDAPSINGIPVGALLLYMLVNSNEFEFSELLAGSKDGEGQTIVRKEQKPDLLDSPEHVASLFSDQSMTAWELKGHYHTADIQIIGDVRHSLISTLTPVVSAVDTVRPLIKKVETDAKQYQASLPA